MSFGERYHNKNSFIFFIARCNDLFIAVAKIVAVLVISSAGLTDTVREILSSELADILVASARQDGISAGERCVTQTVGRAKPDGKNVVALEINAQREVMPYEQR